MMQSYMHYKGFAVASIFESFNCGISLIIDRGIAKDGPGRAHAGPTKSWLCPTNKN